jgi:hypothetical protein
MLLLTGAGWLWFVQDRATRRAAETLQARDREHRANAELARATGLRERALVNPAESRSLLAEALAAAERADGILAEGSADEELRQRTRQLVTDFQQEEFDRLSAHFQGRNRRRFSRSITGVRFGASDTR